MNILIEIKNISNSPKNIGLTKSLIKQFNFLRDIIVGDADDLSSKEG